VFYANVPSVLGATMRAGDDRQPGCSASRPGWLGGRRSGALVRSSPHWCSPVRRPAPVAGHDADRYESDFHLPRARQLPAAPCTPFGRQPDSRYETLVQGLYLTGAATFPAPGGASGLARQQSSSVTMRRERTREKRQYGRGRWTMRPDLPVVIGPVAPGSRSRDRSSSLVLALHHRRGLRTGHPPSPPSRCRTPSPPPACAGVGHVVSDQDVGVVKPGSRMGGRIIGTSSRSSTPV
jgi:hypothetical protein